MQIAPTISPYPAKTAADRPRFHLLGGFPRGFQSTDAKTPGWAAEDLPRRFSPKAVYQAGLRHHHIANTAYPIAHRKTIGSYRQPRERHRDLIQQAFAPEQEMGLYIHIPFCERRCAFCEYTVVKSHDEESESRYHQALLQEIGFYSKLLKTENKTLVGLDIGGGTPSLIAPWRVGQLVRAVRSAFLASANFSISIETTPKIAAKNPERLHAYQGMGIDRISMGLQMVNPRLLAEYGRDIHKVSHNPQAVENIRKAGFKRFNIDLMYGFAKQSLADFERTLAYTISLAPEYITLYRMRYKGTRVADEAASVSLAKVMAMYELAREMLLSAGYLANPGKNGFSRSADDPGTSEYLTERVVYSTPYLGLGLGAQTFTNQLLAYNLGAADKRLNRYLKAVDQGRLPIQDLYHLPRGEAMAKMIAVSFYFGQIHLGAFEARFGLPLESRFGPEIAFLLERDLMRYKGESLRLTQKGAKTINGIIALFYSDRVKAHLLEEMP